MKNQIFLHKFKNFLATKVFEADNIELERAKRGGSSINFICQADNVSYFIKLLQKNSSERIQRICQILKILVEIPQFHTASLISVEGHPYFEYEDYIGVVLTYVSGKKIKPHELSPKLLEKILDDYRYFQNAPFSNKKLVLPFISEQDLYIKNKNKIVELEISCPSHKLKILNTIKSFNELLLQDAPYIPGGGIKRIIHGDANLNNLIIDKNQNIYFLDFETLRFGYTAEDVMFLILSAILPHSVFFLPTKQLRELLSYLKNKGSFSKEELLYGTLKYFQFLIMRRIYHSKFLKSPRKDWLFLQYLKKYRSIRKLIESTYVGYIFLFTHLAECI